MDDYYWWGCVVITLLRPQATINARALLRCVPVTWACSVYYGLLQNHCQQLQAFNDSQMLAILFSVRGRY